MPEAGYIKIKGAKEHNLKNIDLSIPRNKMVVITGLSGSGKSSLAFDTIYAEGQRRYVESLSAYARQFLSLMEKPDVEYIEGLSPAISIEQRVSPRNPRSTVGTVTEIYDYLRLLYSRIGIPYCYKCGKLIERQTVQQMADTILELQKGTRVQILSPIVRGRKGEYREVFAQARRNGYVRVRVDGEIESLDEEIKLAKYKKHNIEIVVDRLVIGNEIRGRLTESLETALELANGMVLVDVIGEKETLFSEHFACPDCGVSFEELQPRMFSFNSPFGACPACDGIGTRLEIDPDLMVPNPDLSIWEGAVTALGEGRDGWFFSMVKKVAEDYGFSLHSPWSKLTEEQKNVVLHGTGDKKIKVNWVQTSGKFYGEFNSTWEGIIPNLQRRYRQTGSPQIREWIENYMGAIPCDVCKGERLRIESRSVRIGDMTITKLTSLSVKEALKFFEDLKLSEKDRTIARQILKELLSRLRFLRNVGLDYLTLDRSAGSLAGGEAQRIRLATQIGSQLVGVLYILDEPSIGLHLRDNKRLIQTLLKLRDLGNTVIVVEHDRETIESADEVIDLGPGAGVQGGKVVAQGPPEAIKRSGSLTGKYLAGEEVIPIPAHRRSGSGNKLILKGAKGNNLQNITVEFPLGKFIVVTGVSGSGKSTLVNETLYPALAQRLFKSKLRPLEHKFLYGSEYLDKVIDIDQSPIGRTPRSNPATYTGVFTPIRDLFTQLPEAKMRGYKPGRFSFNVKGGRCEACHGDGIIKIEMHFLPDVYVLCEECKGRRYNRETLEILFKGRSIADVLDMTVDEALVFMHNIPVIHRKLKTLSDVGLGYIKLGQQATTLSGGEAQRVKLASELSKVATGRTLYILDEPTTGLHFADIKMLLRVLNSLVDKGNTVLVIEHNMDVIKTADHIIDLGPEGGDEGGLIIAQGTPEEITESKKSYTGSYLKDELKKFKAAG
ncbi:MAG: excinuclease ABC subunit UvrA [candidate division Zixibacteria bacterium]|nr:excinuclease ABC subunit UvrA [Candidatus Tariuqbacter arcticus]